MLLLLLLLWLVADEELQERCLPGWVWVETRGGERGVAARPPPQQLLLGYTPINPPALAALHGPGYAPQQEGPAVLTILPASNAASSARFGSRPGTDPGRKQRCAGG